MSRRVRFVAGRFLAVLTASTAAVGVVMASTPASAAIGPNTPGGARGASSAAAATSSAGRDIVAMVGADGPGGTAQGGGGTRRCSWRTGRLAPSTGTIPIDPKAPWAPVELVGPDGVKSVLYERLCPGQPVTWMWIRQTTSQQLATIGADMVRRKLPLPGGEFSPAVSAGSAAVVHLPLWFAVRSGQWAPVSATASVPGLTATVTARPDRLTFTPGDGGSPVSCAGPGPRFRPGMREPARPPACSYTYRDASTTAPGGASWPSRLSIRWQVSWVATNGAGGDLAPLTTTTTYAVPVQEIQAIEAANQR